MGKEKINKKAENHFFGLSLELLKTSTPTILLIYTV